MTQEVSYQPCGRKDCDRPVPITSSITFCCSLCAAASNGKYELDFHSDHCDARFGERDWVVEQWRTRSNLIDLPFQ